MDSPREEMFSRDSGVEVRFIIRLHIIQVNMITSERIQVYTGDIIQNIIQVMTLQIFLVTLISTCYLSCGISSLWYRDDINKKRAH